MFLFYFTFNILAETIVDCTGAFQDVLPSSNDRKDSVFQASLRQDIFKVKATERGRGSTAPATLQGDALEDSYDNAIRAYFSQSYTNALNLLDDILDNFPFHTNAYYFRGLTYGRLKKIEKSISDFELAHLLYPREALLYFHIGRMKFFSDDYRDALLYLNYAIDNHIFIADSFYYRSLAKYNMGEMLSALLDIEKSIAWVPNNESFVRTRGSFNLSLRDFSNAVVDFSVAVSIDPNNPVFYFGRGVAYLYSGKHLSAYEDLTKSLELNSVTHLQFFPRPSLYEDLTKSLELNSGPLSSHKALTYYFRGEVSTEMGNFLQAFKDFNQALKFAPDDQKEILQQKLTQSSDNLKEATKFILDFD